MALSSSPPFSSSRSTARRRLSSSITAAAADTGVLGGSVTKMRASSSRTYMRGSSNSSISRGAGGRSSHSALGSPGAAAGCWDAASVIPVDGPSRQNEGDGDGCCTEMSPPLSDRPHGEGHGGGSMETSPPPSASPALSDGGGYRCYEVSPGSITTVHPLRARNGTKGRQKETPSTGGGGGGSGGGGSQDIGIGGCGGHGGGGSRAKDADLTVRGTSAAAPPSGFEQYYQQQSKGDAGDNGDDARSDTVARRSVISHGESGGGAAIGDNSGASTVIWGIIRDMELQRQLRAELMVGRQAAAVTAASAEAAAAGVHAAGVAAIAAAASVRAELVVGQQAAETSASEGVSVEHATGVTPATGAAASEQAASAEAAVVHAADGDCDDDGQFDEYTEHWEEEDGEEEEGDGADSSMAGVGIIKSPSVCMWSPNPTFNGGCRETSGESMSSAGGREAAEGNGCLLLSAEAGLAHACSVSGFRAAPAPAAAVRSSSSHGVPAAFVQGLINPMYEEPMATNAGPAGHRAGDDAEGAAAVGITRSTGSAMSPRSTGTATSSPRNSSRQQQLLPTDEGAEGKAMTAGAMPAARDSSSSRQPPTPDVGGGERAGAMPASRLPSPAGVGDGGFVGVAAAGGTTPARGSGSLKPRRSIDISGSRPAVVDFGLPLIDALQRILLD